MCFRFRKNFLNITDMSCFIAKSKHIIQKIAHSTNFQENIIGKSQDIIERLYMRITNIECGIQVSSPLFLFGSSILCQKTKRTCPELLKFIHHLRILIFFIYYVFLQMWQAYLYLRYFKENFNTPQPGSRTFLAFFFL